MKKVSLSELSAGDRRLVQAAIAIRQKAYAPFSQYKCGAALRDIKNRIHVGCNIETIDFTLTTHAEMDAINGMIKTGTFQLKALACAVQSSSGYALPCGLCRQKIREFATGPDARIIAINLTKQGKIRHISVTTIGEIYPLPFTPAGLT
ncbi:MAG TPA: cytidine deaminase [Kiritimatiellia bacterium]|jgi:cytidine deaminase|nr:MAG: Cytidine deaminase [Verrucomicrobia bacterium ADurb.Bin018]HOD99766.1 cytidine deaminase [Kiritimatiellia bacterium]HOE36162.1 cytidine deaminase [Kiritimatiellia bacterium]HOR73796.1 cytidine deaminase [Kiritimatiellia bacterium]HOU58168.1 cytidine deaminase [Kiritimatiellia bacterium]